MMDTLECLVGWMKSLFFERHLLAKSKKTILTVPNRQNLTSYACGICAIKNVSEYHGKLIKNIDYSNFVEGMDETEMVAIFRANGFKVSKRLSKVTDFKIITSALKEKLPVIVSTVDHFFVIVGQTGRYFHVNDPNPYSELSGTLSKAEFKKIWSGYSVLVTGLKRM